MLAGCDLVAFVATTDLVRAKAFYVDTLRLPLVEESPYACVLDANGTAVRVTPVEALPPAPHTVLGWTVPEIEEAVQDLAGRGVIFDRFEGVDQDEHGVWDAPGGARVAWFRDPDGNRLSLTQPPRPT
jgi:catechol 2,3-dioxygenase-like lactoylglutathione lyase family enzyme